MGDQTIPADAGASSRAESDSSATLQIAVLSAVAAIGVLSTNILLPALPEMAASLKTSTAEITSAITVFLAVFATAQLLIGPISDRYGRRLPVLAGFVVFLAGTIWCGLANDMPNMLVGRVIQGVGACATSGLTRAIARDLFGGAALARALALIMIAMAAAPGFSPLLGGALDHYFGWRSEFAFVGLFAAGSAIAYIALLRETRRSTPIPLDPRAIARTYLGLMTDRRFVVPVAAVSLVMAGLFAMFASVPRILIEDMRFTPIDLGLFFAGTVMIVFAAGFLAPGLATRFGLSRSIRAGLVTAAAGSAAVFAVSIFSTAFLPFLAALCVFLLGMGIVNPLGTAQSLSPFGEKAGAASALIGFCQTMGMAIGAYLAAIVSRDAMFALGLVQTVTALAAFWLYTMRVKED
jgi:DHA1 family bicyclomycin/chloramphenicol resistance-like MFS transporter